MAFPLNRALTGGDWLEDVIWSPKDARRVQSKGPVPLILDRNDTQVLFLESLHSQTAEGKGRRRAFDMDVDVEGDDHVLRPRRLEDLESLVGREVRGDISDRGGAAAEEKSESELAEEQAKREEMELRLKMSKEKAQRLQGAAIAQGLNWKLNVNLRGGMNGRGITGKDQIDPSSGRMNEVGVIACMHRTLTLSFSFFEFVA